MHEQAEKESQITTEQVQTPDTLGATRVDPETVASIVAEMRSEIVPIDEDAIRRWQAIAERAAAERAERQERQRQQRVANERAAASPQCTIGRPKREADNRRERQRISGL